MTAAQLRRALRRLKLSQRRLARRLEIHVGTVNRWATDRTPIPESVALLLACWEREGKVPSDRKRRR